MGALVRFILSLVIAILTISIIDKPNLPQWFLKILWLDGVNKAYLSMIYMYHLHNHPILITFAYLLSKNKNKYKNHFFLQLKIFNSFLLVHHQKVKNSDSSKIENKSRLDASEYSKMDRSVKVAQIARKFHVAYLMIKYQHLNLKSYRKCNLTKLKAK